MAEKSLTVSIIACRKVVIANVLFLYHETSEHTNSRQKQSQ